jgi:chaperonin cofactor prefoldin
LSEETEFDWDMKVELLEIELEAIRKEIEELGKKFDRMEKGLENDR